jgi:AcrR family transcriptional regulator
MKSMTDHSSRAYRKRKRAQAEAETRRRITEAAVELHGTVGPANSTVTQVAKLAGVSRMTVYNHFPTEVDLFVACSSHWAAQNPFPDPSSWTDPDPAERLGTALEELYGWYGRKQQMLGNVLRDTPIVPALAEVMTGLWAGFMDAAVQALGEGWPSSEEEPRTLRGMLRLAVDFDTWRTLTGAGLDEREAAHVMRRAVTCAARGGQETPYHRRKDRSNA